MLLFKKWLKCKKFWSNKYIHGFWITNGSVKIKMSANCKPKEINYVVDSEKLFPGNNLIRDRETEL